MKLSELAFFTDNVAEMAAFYQRLLGVDPVHADDSMAIFMFNGVKYFIHETYEVDENSPLPPDNHMAFTVENVDNAVQQLSEKGMTLDVAPADYYWGRSAYMRDPDGHLIEITAGS